MPSTAAEKVAELSASSQTNDENPSAKAVAAIKQPPPESAEAIRQRRNVVLSFWSVVIFLGLPLWWVTTAIYRAPLPISEMQNWAEGRACRVEFPLLVELEPNAIPDPGNLIKSIQHNLDDANDFSAHHIRLRLAPSADPKGTKEEGDGEKKELLHTEVAATIKLVPGAKGTTKPSYNLHRTARAIDIQYPPTYNPSSPASLSGLSSFIAATLQEIFAEEQQMITHLLTSSSYASGGQPVSASSSGSSSSNPANSAAGGNGAAVQGRVSSEIQRKMSRMVRYSPTYHITISLFTATSLPRSWDIVPAIEAHLSPLLKALEHISIFTVDSQIQYYASLSPNVVPSWDEELKAFTLKKVDLSSFVNSAEWPLSSLGEGTALNFVVYIPPPNLAPLLIPSSPSNAFLIPQWGGILVYNPPWNTNVTAPPSTQKEFPHLSKETLTPLLQTFTTQLLLLLGAPTTPKSLPLLLKLDTLTRHRSAELLISASSTLGSLARLISALPNISIPPTVQHSVQSTLQDLQKTCSALKRGGFKEALESGRRASWEAERAFFERTMVAQVYFPEEHKVAVYLPLLGPVGVPLVMGAVRVLRNWRAAGRG